MLYNIITNQSAKKSTCINLFSILRSAHWYFLGIMQFSSESLYSQVVYPAKNCPLIILKQKLHLYVLSCIALIGLCAESTLSLSCITGTKDIVVVWSEDLLTYDNIIAFEVGTSLISNCSLPTSPPSIPQTVRNVTKTLAEFNGLQPDACYLFFVRPLSLKLLGNWSSIKCSTYTTQSTYSQLSPSTYVYLVMACVAVIIIVSIIAGSVLYVVYR